MFARSFIALAAVALSSTPAAAGPACPSPEGILERVAQAHPELGSRTTRFGSEVPVQLYRKASSRLGEPVAARDGKTVWGVIVTEHPVELIWKALNDEPHHALDDGKYVPVRHSEVIAGVPRGQSRELFQYFKKVGIGRWWVSRVTMNGKLYEDSGGKLWELTWNEIVDQIDPSRPPMNAVSGKLKPLDDSYGAWLVIPVADRCTFIEYYNHTEPGGFVSFAQGLLAKSSVRDTLAGIVRLAEEHFPEPDPHAVFVRPDGTRLD